MVTKEDAAHWLKGTVPKVAATQPWDVLSGSRYLLGLGGLMSNGRSEKRIPKTVSVEVRLVDEPTVKERPLTENVSAHGVRVLAKRRFRPKQQAIVISPNDVRSPAKVVYCELVAENMFAVGLQLFGKVESWASAC
jgi:hypothetical protein